MVSLRANDSERSNPNRCHPEERSDEGSHALRFFAEFTLRSFASLRMTIEGLRMTFGYKNFNAGPLGGTPVVEMVHELKTFGKINRGQRFEEIISRQKFFCDFANFRCRHDGFV